MTNENDVGLPIGKLPNTLLDTLLQKPFFQRPEVITGPGVGEDCAVLDIGDSLLVMSTDPITGTDADIGMLGVNVAMNDLGAAGAEPVAMMVTLLCPPGSTVNTISHVMDQIRESANHLGAAIVGGHTEITDSVNRFVLSITAIGKAKKGHVVSTKGAIAGDTLFVTKNIALEGTAILATTYQHELTDVFGAKWLQKAFLLGENLSVVAEGLSAATFGVHAMHDITEGGVLGAVWEMCHAAGLGCELQEDQIPIQTETLDLCNWLGIDPLKLISSGSMLIACDKPDEFASYMTKHGHLITAIGVITENTEKMLVSSKKTIMILPPEADELYRALKIRKDN